MKWNQIVGHTGQIVRLRALLDSGKMPHALLFTGPDGIGKSLVASILATALLCQNETDRPCGECSCCRQAARQAHPDLLEVKPEGATLKIEQIRELQKEVAFAPHIAQTRVCIIEDAEKMTAQAANSLLKTLEEPGSAIVFILLSSRPQLLLDTIVSRCMTLHFMVLPSDVLADALITRGTPAKQAAVVARLAGGRLGSALELLQPEGMGLRDQAAAMIFALMSSSMQYVWNTAMDLDKMERQQLLALLRYCEMLLRDILLLITGQDSRLLYNLDLQESLAKQSDNWDEVRILNAVNEISHCRRALQTNANPRLTGEALLIKLRELAQGG